MPQFTIQELQQVLMERSQLKTRLIEVDVELNQYCLRCVLHCHVLFLLSCDS